jgi:hypothetical protein
MVEANSDQTAHDMAQAPRVLLMQIRDQMSPGRSRVRAGLWGHERSAPVGE